jgi:hypothetical protein
VNTKVLEYTESLGIQSIILDRRIHNLPEYDKIPAWVNGYNDAVVRDYQGFPSL